MYCKQKYLWITAIILMSPLLVSAQWLETTITVEDGPRDLVYNPANNKIYSANHGNFLGTTVSVIDGATNEVINTIEVGWCPRVLAYNRVNNKVYCGKFGGRAIVIDGTNDIIIDSMLVGSDPRSMVYNSIDNKVYCTSTANEYITVIDGEEDTVITTIITGLWPTSLVHDSVNNKVYCTSSYEGTVTIIDGATDTVISVVYVGNGARLLAYNPVENKVYCVRHNGNGVAIDGVADTIIAHVVTDYWPEAIVYNPSNNKVYIASFTTGNIFVIDCVTDTIETTMLSLGRARALFYNSINNLVYCSGDAWTHPGGVVTVIDPTVDTTICGIRVGDTPCAFAWNPVQNRMYVANFEESSVSVIRDSLTGIEVLPQNASPRIVNLYPNPAKTSLTINTSTPLYNIRIYDVLGTLVRTDDMVKPETRTTISLKNLSAGVYFVNVNIKGAEFTRKVVVTQ